MEGASAVIDETGTYRYDLRRQVLGVRVGCATWIMLNPSVASADVDDPTIRRCMRFTADWGYHEMRVVNLFALRATNPKELRTHVDPVGPDNDAAIVEAHRNAHLVIAAWGADTFAVERARHVRAMMAKQRCPMMCLGTTKSGAPRHPLYVPAATQPQFFAGF